MCSGFRLLPDLGLGGGKCPRIYPFLPSLLVYELFVIISDDGLNICGICGDTPLSFFIASIWLFSLFFFINLVSGLSILLIFLKNQSLDLLIFLKGFLCL